MCTLTWRPAPTVATARADEGRRSAGYDLWFNRDELHTRAPELPPEEQRVAGVTCWAPRDAEHGGTWLLLNAHGLTVAVVNFYPGGAVAASGAALTPATTLAPAPEPEAAGRASRPRRSRGVLPWALAGAADTTAARRALTPVAWADFAPCHLFIVDAAAEAWLATWDGRECREAPAPAMLTSSSYRTAEIEAVRRARFRVAPPASAAEAWAFHRAHDPADGPASVCMRRLDAATRSVCHVHVRPAAVELEYRALRWSRSEVGFGGEDEGGANAAERSCVREEGPVRRGGPRVPTPAEAVS